MKAMKYLYDNKKRALITAFSAVIICLLILLIYATIPINDRRITSTIEIPRGASFIKIVDILDQTGLVKYKPLFYILAVSKGAARQIRAGEYEFISSMTPTDIIDKLVKGKIKEHWVTIPEDFSLREIAAILASPDNKLVSEMMFLNVTSDRQFLDSLGIKSATAEGYLYPDTYLFDRSMSSSDIVTIMVNQFWKKVTPEMFRYAEKIGLTGTEFITLASIIGKESGNKEEKVLISAVFHNRLKKGMKLQSDPTAIYDLDNFKGGIKRSHLRRDSPYNTYLIDGLPPGPIANPGLDSFQAVLNPAPFKYLYFVSKNDGTHLFSSNLSDHNNAVLKYQTARKK